MGVIDTEDWSVDEDRRVDLSAIFFIAKG